MATKRRAKKAGAKRAAAKKSAAKRARDKIRADIKREVRQRCGFGCVICGAPIYHYEHMVDYAKEQKHEAENITLLCPSHHQDKTNKLLPLQKVREANANPRNLQTGASKPRRYYFGTEQPTIILGGAANSRAVAFRPPEGDSDFAAIVIDTQPIIGFRFEDGQPLLQLRLYDQHNNLVLQVVDSQLIYSVDSWDIEFVGQVLTIRQAKGDILVQMRFMPDQSSVAIERGRLQYNKVEVEIWPDAVAVLNSCSSFSGFTLVSHIGILLGRNPRRYQALLNVPDIPREFDRDAAKKYIANQRKLSKQLDENENAV